MIVVPGEFSRNSPTVTSLMTPEQSGLWLLERMRRQIGFESYADKKVLDFGCGVRFTQAIINTDLPFGRYVGIDAYRPMIEFLRENVRDPRFAYYFLDAYHPMYNPRGAPLTPDSSLPVGERDFDIVCMFSVITHQYPDDSRSILSMLRRHVGADGHLFFTCFLDEAIDAFEDRSPQRDGGRCFYNPGFLNELVESCGWRQVGRAPLVGPLIGHSFLYRASQRVDSSDEAAGYGAEARPVAVAPVCIAGMHRSGTSMVTRLLKDCGLFLGAEEELVGPALDNAEGFWENLNFVGLNEELLARFGGSWDEPPAFPPRWEFEPVVDPLLGRAGEQVARFSGHRHWGWKDPRNSLTIPFWRRVVPTLKFVVCVRNPLEVAHSLFVRGDSTGASQFRLWLHHYRQILSAAPLSSRIVTHYHSYFEDAHAEVRRVVDWLGLDPSDETVERALAQVSGALRHHHATTDELKAAGASDEVSELYLRLCDEAGPVCHRLLERESRHGSSGAPPRQPSAEAYALQLMRLDNQLAKGEERLHLLERQYASLEAQLHEARASLHEAQLHNEGQIHEVRANLLPLMRALDALRAVRNRLRSIMRGRSS